MIKMLYGKKTAKDTKDTKDELFNSKKLATVR